jgi:hypothetical protein
MEQREPRDKITYELRDCPQSGSSNSQVRLTGRDNMLGLDGLFYVSRCDRCGLWFQSPSLKQELLSKHYPDDYAPYSVGEMSIGGRAALWFLKTRKGYTHLQDQAPISWLKQLWGKWSCGMQLLPDYVPNGRLLEVGCASGNRLALLRKLG